MKTKIISVLFLLVCIGIMIAGCSSPSTSSSQGNYQQQSNQANTQSSSNLDPIVGCWGINYGDQGGDHLVSTLVLDSSGSGYLRGDQTNANGISSFIFKDSVNWAKISDSKYSLTDHSSQLGKDIYYTVGYSNGILTIEVGNGIVYHKTTC